MVKYMVSCRFSLKPIRWHLSDCSWMGCIDNRHQFLRHVFSCTILQIGIASNFWTWVCHQWDNSRQVSHLGKTCSSTYVVYTHMHCFLRTSCPEWLICGYISSNVHIYFLHISLFYTPWSSHPVPARCTFSVPVWGFHQRHNCVVKMARAGWACLNRRQVQDQKGEKKSGHVRVLCWWRCDEWPRMELREDIC